MVLTLTPRGLTDFSTLSAEQAAALLDCARALRSGARRGALRGRNFGVLCETPGDADADRFRRATSALGARVAQLQPTLSATSSAAEWRDTARLLGQLYDAIDCVGLPPALVRRLDAEAGVPVFEAIASPRHPLAWLADQIDGEPADDERRCLMVQAVLLNCL